MGRVPPPKEQSGCIQTLIISRMIIQILIVPLLMIMGMIVSAIIALFAFSEHVALGFGVLIAAALLIYAAARWEYRRVSKEMLPPEE